ncbi:hypothetical protein HanRHA438_Chr16g0777901 [Helianthus annuus]|nr:hypothetical protein HanRHA438_Chr16g0777901 [Helianthus annuus]
MVVNWRNRRRRSGVVSTAAESRCRSYSLTIDRTSRWVFETIADVGPDTQL